MLSRELYQCNTTDPSLPQKTPTPHGVLDRRMGTSEKGATCDTCGFKLAECSGHFGSIRLALPCYNIGFFKAILQILQSICKQCSSLLLQDPEERLGILKRLRTKNLEGLIRTSILKGVHERSKKHSFCRKCSSYNGTVKKVGLMKITHDYYLNTNSTSNTTTTNNNNNIEFVENSSKCAFFSEEERRCKNELFSDALQSNSELKMHISRAQDDLNPIRVKELFEMLSSEDLELLGFRGGDNDHPLNFLWRSIPVPPSCIRPSVAMSLEGGSNEDDLTVKLSEIVYTNAIIEDALAKGSPVSMMIEDWDFLQLQCAMYVNSDLPGITLPAPASGGAQGGAGAQQPRPIRGLCQRLKGKMGRFRGNLSGKRVDFSSRTVISPDPNLAIDEVGVPVYVAKTLTYPQTVTSFNIAMLRQAVLNGPDQHPGANFIQQKSTSMKRYLRFGDRRRIAKELCVGDTVERHLIDGDVVLFNRQPSLHRLSIMAHRVIVRPWRTFRFNECVCAPYNADFDGDEMNLHLPQGEEARAEALMLMGVKENLVTPRNGMPLVAATQDFITASYLLTGKDVLLDRDQFSQLASSLLAPSIATSPNRRECIKFLLPQPAIIRPFARWTGKQLISLIIRPYECSSKINLEAKTRMFQKPANDGTSSSFEMCPNDGYLVVRDSLILLGRLDKSCIGADSKTSIFYILLRDYGADAAIDAMARLAKLTSRFLGQRGFSIGINDVQAGKELMLQKDLLVKRGYEECKEKIILFDNGKLESQPGCTEIETLESAVSGILSRIRDDAGQRCIMELSRNNSPLIMQACGSKGSRINVSQMVACVGQQIVGGARIADGFEGRTLPHFQDRSNLANIKSPPAKGFVANSFYTGLTPTEFFFHAVSGREGLVDTAVKTAETGYMQRRLMKALEDLSIAYDGTVRDGIGGIVQFRYGDDSLDPTLMEGCETAAQPVNFVRLLQHSLSVSNSSDDDDCSKIPLTEEQVLSVMDETITSSLAHSANMTENGDRHSFLVKMEDFVKSYIVGRMHRYSTIKDVSLRIKLSGITNRQLVLFLQTALKKWQRGFVEPGTAVGALGAQSIGEPGTQMTLKTFHFAGVASMNITLGVPRIKEIINASKNISTPIITTFLENEGEQRAARVIKGKIERTLLGDLCRSIKECYLPPTKDGFPAQSFLNIHFDLESISALQLNIGMLDVKDSLLKSSIIGRLLKQGTKIEVVDEENVRIYHLPTAVAAAKSGYTSPTTSPTFPKTASTCINTFVIPQLRRLLPKVVLCGISGVQRAVINDLSGNGEKYNLLVEGHGLLGVIGTPGVDGTRCSSNNIMEVESVLGIEAARQTIINEVQYTMGKHGMTIDNRHVTLLSDVMTYRGEVLGITRFGIARMKDSVLMLASFEKTTDHLFDAARYGKTDHIDGVSECIIMGSPMPIGTGMFKVVHKEGSKHRKGLRTKGVLFDREELHPALL